MVSFSKYICSFLPEILLLVSSCNVLYVLVCTHFVITPFSEVEICREVFNVSEFHFSEVYFFQTWYFSLAHCISRDLKMGAGIAKTFRDKFGRIQELSDQKANIGEIAILKVESKFIYNLVTKNRYFDKPTYKSLRQSLVAMKEHAVKNQVKNIAMPKIGCGLDRLEWDTVSNLIMNVFLDTPVNIDVYLLEYENQSGNQRS